jgi:AbrB family looped-hinge helix DNA binding protein
MKVTTQGRITIPKKIREQFGIHPGDHVEFKIDGDRIKIVSIRNAGCTGKHLVDQMRGRATLRMSTDEILALMRGDS